MRLLVLVWASVLFTAAHAQPVPGAGLQPQKIKVLSWNIYMLPGFLGFGKLERSEAIGKLLAEGTYDVIVFQEAFHGPARKRIQQHLSATYPYQAGPANAPAFSLKTNSGLWIFSKHPIDTSYAMAFETRYGIDAFSRKGALLVQLNVNGQRIQVIATHLQNAGAAWRKQQQCAELYQYLEAYRKPGVPQLICGDFNIDRYTAGNEYQQMLSTLQAENLEMQPGSISYDRANNDLQVEKGNAQSLLDFLLTRTNQAWLTCGERNIRRLQYAWHPRHHDLSDHYSLEAEVTFSNTQQVVTAAR